MTEKKNIIFDGTILNEVQACAMKAYLGHELNLRPPLTATPLEEGDLLHNMLEHYYKGIKERGTELIYSDDEFHKFIDECVDVGEKHSVTHDSNLTGDETTQVIYQFQAYCKHYRMDGIEPKFVEEPFIVKLYEDEGMSVHYTGKIDLIGEIHPYGQAVMDHKKASRAVAPTSLSNQFTGYSFATGLRTVVVNKVGFQKTKEPEDRFRRYPIFYTEEQIDRWKKNTIWWAQQYAFYLEEGCWPENRTSCDKYGGCIFEDICASSTDEAREWVMKQKYVIGDPWDVTAILKDKV